MKASPFPSLCGVGLLAIFSSTLSKSPVLPLFASHLGGDASAVGMVASVSALSGMLLSIPAGTCSDRWGRKRLLSLAAAVLATAPLLYPWVTELWQLALIRLYHGAATAVLMPVAMAMVSDLFRKERGEKMGWFSTATLAGRFLAPMAGGMLLTALATAPVQGFQWVYGTCAATGLLAFWMVLRLPEQEAEASCYSLGDAYRGLRTVVSNRPILLAASAEAAVLFAYGTFETFLPLHCRDLGMSTTEIGMLLSAQVLTLGLSKPLMGRFSDRHGRKPQIVWGSFLGALAMGGFALTEGAPVLLAWSVLFGLGFAVVSSATAAFIADSATEHTKGSAMGVLGSVMDIGHTTGPLAAGMLASFWGLPFAFLGGMGMLTMAASIFLISSEGDGGAGP